MLEVGRVCIKTAGRDAAKHCVVIEEVDDKSVLVDGITRRRKVNKLQLEPLAKKLDVKKGADTKTVLAALEKAGFSAKKATEKKKRTSPKAQTKKIRKGQDQPNKKKEKKAEKATSKEKDTKKSK